MWPRTVAFAFPALSAWYLRLYEFVKGSNTNRSASYSGDREYWSIAVTKAFSNLRKQPPRALQMWRVARSLWQDWFIDNGRGLALPGRQCWPSCSAGRDASPRRALIGTTWLSLACCPVADPSRRLSWSDCVDQELLSDSKRFDLIFLGFQE